MRLSAQFHMILAEATDNHFVVQQMQELVSRTAMLVAMHESGSTMECSCDEHRDIFNSLLKGDGASAARAMRAHLSLIETRLKPRVPANAQDAIGLLQQLWAESILVVE